MKNYAVFYVLRNGSYSVPCGSDSILQLDSRLGHARQLQSARAQIQRLKAIRTYAAFSIQRGSIRTLNLDDNPLINLYQA